MTDQILASVIARGDLAHLTLMLWAGAASLLAAWLLRELAHQLVGQRRRAHQHSQSPARHAANQSHPHANASVRLRVG